MQDFRSCCSPGVGKEATKTPTAQPARTATSAASCILQPSLANCSTAAKQPNSSGASSALQHFHLAVLHERLLPNATPESQQTRFGGGQGLEGPPFGPLGSFCRERTIHACKSRSRSPPAEKTGAGPKARHFNRMQKIIPACKKHKTRHVELAKPPRPLCPGSNQSHAVARHHRGPPSHPQFACAGASKRAHDLLDAGRRGRSRPS